MPGRDYRRLRLAVGLAVAIGAFRTADAAPTARFDIPRQALSASLTAFAEQAGLSISTSRVAQCGPQGQAVAGRMPADQALTRLLDGTGCTFRYIDARAVEVIPRPRSAPPPPQTIQIAPPPLSELVIVATRRATPADRLAYPVTSTSATVLSGQGIADASDLAQIEPSMTVTNLGSGRDKILLRGLSDGPLTGRTQSMVGIYLDDVRLAYSAPDPDLRMTDIAQVEVLRGPQGALYGSGSLGGVLHMITNAPDPRAVSGMMSGSLGAARSAGASSAAEGVLNLPTPWRGGAVRLVGYRDVGGGYIDDAALGLHDVNRTVRSGVRLTASQTISDHWTASAGLIGQSISADDTQYALASFAPYQRANQLREPHDNDFAVARAGIDGDLGELDLHGSIAAVRHHLVSRYDASAAPPVPTPPGPLAYDDDNNIASVVAELTLASKAAARLQWLAGAFYAQTRQTVGLRLSAPTPASSALFAEARQDELDEGALFGQAILPLADRWNITLGGRVFATDLQVSSRIDGGPTAQPIIVSAHSVHHGFAPKFVLSYERDANLLLYAQAAEGYRAGGVNTTGPAGQVFSAPGGAEPNRLYLGDELWSLEAGARLRLLEGRLIVRTAVFDAIWKSIQSDQLLPSGLPFTANIGDGQNFGLEVEGVYRAGTLSLGGTLLVNSPELVHPNPAFPTRPEIGLAGVPGMSASLTAHYAWPLGDDRVLALDGRTALVGRSHLAFDAQTAPGMGGYATMRLAATMSDPHWRLTLAIENPANTRGDTFAYGNPFTLRSTPQVTPQRPRTATVTLERRF